MGLHQVLGLQPRHSLQGVYVLGGREGGERLRSETPPTPRGRRQSRALLREVKGREGEAREGEARGPGVPINPSAHSQGGHGSV